jgi:hypothetical protein
MRTPLLLALALAVPVAGCNRKKTESKIPEPATSQAAAQPAVPAAQGDARAPDAGVMPEPSKDGLKSLCKDPNPYISNNAKHALSSWEAKDYSAAATGMRKIISLCQSTAQQNAASSSLARLKLEIDKAAANGNANAKEAAAQLARAGSP